MKTRIYSVLVENRSGVLCKVAGLFSRRCFNIDSLVVGETDNSDVSCMTIVSSGDERTIEQIEKQLNKKLDVIKVKTFAEQQCIARELMLAISLIVLFQAANSIMTKGVLRGGGDTKVLMVADNIFLWAASIPLGILAGPVLHLPAFWICFFLKVDQVLKAVWCVIRLRSGRWIRRIRSSSELQEAD